MSGFVKNLTFDCADALAVARFWAAALGSDVDEDSTPEGAYVEAPAWGGPTSGSAAPAAQDRPQPPPPRPPPPHHHGRGGRSVGGPRRHRGRTLRRHQPLQKVLERAVENYRREQFYAEFNAAFERLRADPAAWKEELAERALWESTLADGLDDW